MAVLYQAFTWPRKCTRKGCNRRPRQAFVTLETDPYGQPNVKFHAVCNRCRDRFVAAVEEAQKEQAN